MFLLPFALSGAFLGYRELGFHLPRQWWIPLCTVFHLPGAWWKLLWIVVAMVGARSAAMAFNRILDAAVDARNPRTRMRHIPAGLLSRGFAWGFTIASSLVFIAAARALNPLCFYLSPLAL